MCIRWTSGSSKVKWQFCGLSGPLESMEIITPAFQAAIKINNCWTAAASGRVPA